MTLLGTPSYKRNASNDFRTRPIETVSARDRLHRFVRLRSVGSLPFLVIRRVPFVTGCTLSTPLALVEKFAIALNTSSKVFCERENNGNHLTSSYSAAWKLLTGSARGSKVIPAKCLFSWFALFLPLLVQEKARNSKKRVQKNGPDFFTHAHMCIFQKSYALLGQTFLKF